MRGSIEHVLEEYRAAVHAKDVGAFVALYDKDVRVFDLWGQWAYKGLDAWRGMALGWFGSLGDEGVAVKLDDVETIEGGDVAVVHAFITFTGLSADGAQLRAMNNRVTWVLVRRNGEWKVAHEHTSAPVDPDNGKVKLTRSASG